MKRVYAPDKACFDGEFRPMAVKRYERTLEAVAEATATPGSPKNSRERIRQIEAHALLKLRGLMAPEMLERGEITYDEAMEAIDKAEALWRAQVAAGHWPDDSPQ